MKTAIYATLLYISATDKKSKHHTCPLGRDSCSFYQRAVANCETPGPHTANIKIPVNETHLSKKYRIIKYWPQINF